MATVLSFIQLLKNWNKKFIKIRSLIDRGVKMSNDKVYVSFAVIGLILVIIGALVNIFFRRNKHGLGIIRQWNCYHMGKLSQNIP